MLSFIRLNMLDMKGHQNYWNIDLLHEDTSVRNSLRISPTTCYSVSEDM